MYLWRLGAIAALLTSPLGNAIKFTEEGEVVLRIGLVEEPESSAVLRLEAKHTGIDMTQE